MTGGQIESYLREGIISFNLPISGGVYIRGFRPLQNEQEASPKEDIVVAVLTGTAGQMQKGSCVVNVYVPDILAPSGVYYKDKGRTDQIEKWMEGVPKALSQRGDIYFARSAMILTLQEESIHQHFVSLKMDFTLLNEDFD